MAAPQRGSLLFDEQTVRELKALRVALRRLKKGEGFAGHRSSAGHGGRFDFSGHVPYTQGEDPRSIDWRLFARLGDLYLKRFQSETNLNILVVMDDSASMASPDSSPWRASLRIAAGVCFAYAGEGTVVTVHKTSSGCDEDRRVIPCRRADQTGSTLTNLGEWENLVGGDSEPVVHPDLLEGRPNAVLLLSDFQNEQPPETLLAACAGKGIQVSCICLMSESLRSPRVGHQVELRDAETDELVNVSISSEHVERYTELFEERQRRMEQSARRVGAGWVELSTPDTIGRMFHRMVHSGVLP